MTGSSALRGLDHTVTDDLPPELAQGLFARPGTYEIVLRYSSEPGAIETDTVPRARGASLKVLDVPGGSCPRVGRARTSSSTPGRSGDVEALRESQLCLAPVAPEQHEAGKREVTPTDPPGVLSDLAREYHAAHPARYELRVQLCTDLDAMPIEDASIPWDQEISPYRPVATIDIPPQESFSPERRVYAERVMSWRPWNGLGPHRPLGSINRLRHRLYQQLGEWRHQTHATAEHNPVRLEEVPD